MQTWIQSNLETLAQNIVGLIISFIILTIWGLPVGESLSLQFVIFIASYTRGYIIRRIFNNIDKRKK